MKKDLIFITVILALFTFITACSKSSSRSVADKLIGTWTITKFAFDGNNNKTADANEWQTLEYNIGGFPVSLNATVNFRKGGTGVATFSVASLLNDSLGLNWVLAGNDQYVNIQTTGTLDPVIAPFIPDLNGSAHIDKLDDHNLVLKDTTTGTVWINMTK